MCLVFLSYKQSTVCASATSPLTTVICTIMKRQYSMKDFEKYEYLVLSVLLKGHFPTMLTVNGVGSGKPEMLERCPAGGFRTSWLRTLKSRN